MLPFEVDVIAQTDLIKYMLIRPILKGRLGKCALTLSEYSLNYIPQKAVKGQAIADFLTDHLNLIPPDEEECETIKLKPLKLMFDGSKSGERVGVGIVLISPGGLISQFAFELNDVVSIWKSSRI